jgi:hypothetical protein
MGWERRGGDASGVGNEFNGVALNGVLSNLLLREESNMALPDFGVALKRSGHSGRINRPFSFKGVGRVDEDLYTLDARADVDGVDHVANIDLDGATWAALLSKLPAEQVRIVAQAGDAPIGDFVELPFVAAAFFCCELGEPQDGADEIFIPLQALAVGRVTRIEVPEDSSLT